MKSLQDSYAPHNACFGCGPANAKGLQVKSVVNENEVIADWIAKPEHEAFPGILNGGIIGTLLDCHSNWAAAHFLMKAHQENTPPCTVTSYFNVSLKRPTSSLKPVHLVAALKKIEDDRAWIEATLYSEHKLCATCDGLFVAVKEGHPAFHRW